MYKLLFPLFLLFQTIATAQAPLINYPVDSASVEHAGVPKGELSNFVFENSKFFPATWMEYWVYVSEIYRVAKPSRVFVNKHDID